MTTKTQTRGNCPCCGHDQAVLADGRMAKHGYTVDNGWFNGVCSGAQFQPMQVQREVTDKLAADVRKQAVELEAYAADLEAGRKVLKTVSRGWGRNETQVAFADAPEWEQRQATNKAVWNARSRAKAGVGFADMMEGLVNAVHGQPLRVVGLPPEVAPIRSGERRTTPNGLTLKATRVERGRVYWTAEDGRRGWTGTQAWRKYQLV